VCDDPQLTSGNEHSEPLALSYDATGRQDLSVGDSAVERSSDFSPFDFVPKTGEIGLRHPLLRIKVAHGRSQLTKPRVPVGFSRDLFPL
jgi:hypothetical protein